MGKLNDLWLMRGTGNLSRNDYRLFASDITSVVAELPDFIVRGEVSKVKIDASGCVVALNDGASFYWDPNQIGSAINLHVLEGSYEKLETKVLLYLAERASMFVDIGANIGYFSIRLLSANDKLRAVAVEALPSTAETLRRNVSLNQFDERVSVINVAVGAESGLCRLYVPSVSGHSAASTKELHPDEASQVVEVGMNTLDSLVSAPLAENDLIKIDVEGGELGVLRGGLSVIADGRPTIFAELLRKWMKPFGAHPNDVIELLATMNYHCLQFSADGLEEIDTVDEETVPTNFLFVQASKIDGLRRQGFFRTN